MMVQGHIQPAYRIEERRGLAVSGMRWVTGVFIGRGRIKGGPASDRKRNTIGKKEQLLKTIGAVATCEGA